MQPKFITVPSSELDSAETLVVSGIACILLGLGTLPRFYPDFYPSLFFVTAGAGFVVLGIFCWTCRLRVAITEQGVQFAPKKAHHLHDFQWSQIQDWYWLISYYTDCEGGQQESKKIVLVLSDGSTQILKWPFCPSVVSEALERHLPPSPTRTLRNS